MGKDIEYNYIMFKNEIVAKYDIKTCQIFPINKDKIATINYNETTGLRTWLKQRTPLLSEENQKCINTVYEKMHPHIDKQSFTTLLFAATNLKDCYWIKPETSDITWEQKNPRTHELSEICYLKDIGLQNQIDYINTKNQDKGYGAADKVWIYEKEQIGKDDKNDKDDKDKKPKIINTYLRKRDNSQRVKAEIAASNILDKTNISHVKYKEIGDYHSCQCKNIADEDYSLINYSEIRHALKQNNISVDNLAKAVNPELYAQMQVIDYLISNPDRSIYNTGFIMDNDTGYICDIAPLYDHGDAFDFSRDNPDSKLKAISALEKSNLKFKTIPTMADFLNDYAQYKAFMQKACELGIFKQQEKHKFLNLGTPEISYTINPKYQSDDISISHDRNAMQYSFKDNAFYEIEEVETEISENENIRNREFEENLTRAFNKRKITI